MGRFIRPVAALFLALFARPGPGAGPAVPEPTFHPQGDVQWYAPLAEDFRPHYERDAANRSKQSWEQYWSWVESFYQGNFFAQGWSHRARWLVQDVRADIERTRLRTKLNALGVEICAEWAKDNDDRKVTSADLTIWGKMLEKARAADDGTGAKLHRTIEEIRKDHRRKTGGAPSQ